MLDEDCRNDNFEGGTVSGKKLSYDTEAREVIGYLRYRGTVIYPDG